MAATSWVSDGGELSIELADSGELLIWLEAGEKADRWSVEKYEGEGFWHQTFTTDEQVDTWTLARDSGELLVVHSRFRRHAAGTEADPRSTTREWRCARVLEGETTT